jgi:hypothetical protein
MPYTLTVPLKDNTDTVSLIGVFQLPYPHYKKFITVSANVNDHFYPQEIDNSLFCSYKIMPEDGVAYVKYYASQVAIKYGLEMVCPVNGKQYAYFYQDNRLVYVVPASDQIDFPVDYFYESFDIHINKNCPDLSVDDGEFKDHCEKLFYRVDSLA